MVSHLNANEVVRFMWLPAPGGNGFNEETSDTI